MRIKSGFVLHEICGNYIIVAEGLENIDYNNVVSMNDTSACVWKAVDGKEFTIDDMVAALTDEFDIDAATAKQDCIQLANKWIEAGLATER